MLYNAIAGQNARGWKRSATGLFAFAMTLLVLDLRVSQRVGHPH